MTHRKFREFLNKCDREGLVCNINRVAPKNYQLIVNYTVVKKYRNRISCKRYVMKLYNKKVSSAVNGGGVFVFNKLNLA